MLRQRELFFPPYHEVLNLWVELLTQNDDPLSTILTGRHINQDSGSDACLSLMREWIHTCQMTHVECKWENKRPLPSRVVDVGSENPPVDPFVFVTDGAIGEWITLSHCWGGQMPITTTTVNLDERRKGIGLDELPPNFRDAIFLTRKLGFRYIWIDALCIVQDSHEDWTAESTQMFDIYAQASLNIALSAARNPQEGIFATSNRDRGLAAPIFSVHSFSSKHNVKGTLSIRPSMPSYPFVWMNNEPLHKRAWVMQESILSPRRLDFGSCELKWFCHSSAKREGFPNAEDSQPADSMASGRDLFKMPLCTTPVNPTATGQLDHRGPLRWWYRTLYRSYIRRGITKHKDVLPAIAGVAEKIAERTAYHYRAGLWLEDIHRGLLWQSQWNVTRPSETSNPSWSWASIDLPWNRGYRRLYLDTYEDGPRAEILDVSVLNAGVNPFGEVLSASLTMRGHYRMLDHWVDEHLPVYNTKDWLGDMKLAHRGRDPKKYNDCATAPPGRIICTLDKRPTNEAEAHEDMLQRQVICMQIGRFGHYDVYRKFSVTVYALMLDPTGQEPEEYRRIGIAEIPEEDRMAEGWELKTVKIV